MDRLTPLAASFLEAEDVDDSASLAIGSFVTAGMIKNNIYHAPRDPSSPNQGREESHGPRQETHGAPTGD